MLTGPNVARWALECFIPPQTGKYVHTQHISHVDIHLYIVVKCMLRFTSGFYSTRAGRGGKLEYGKMEERGKV